METECTTVSPPLPLCSYVKTLQHVTLSPSELSSFTKTVERKVTVCAGRPRCLNTAYLKDHVLLCDAGCLLGKKSVFIIDSLFPQLSCFPRHLHPPPKAPSFFSPLFFFLFLLFVCHRLFAVLTVSKI